MKFNFEGPQSNGQDQEKHQEGLPPIDQGELVFQGELVEYYEKITKLKEDLINAGPAEKEEIEKEIMELQKQMDKANDVLTSISKEKPESDSGAIDIIDEDERKVA